MARPTGNYAVDLLADRYYELDARAGHLRARREAAEVARFRAEQLEASLRAARQALSGAATREADAILLERLNDVRREMSTQAEIVSRMRDERQETLRIRQSVADALIALNGRIPDA